MTISTKKYRTKPAEDRISKSPPKGFIHRILYTGYLAGVNHRTEKFSEYKGSLQLIECYQAQLSDPSNSSITHFYL